MASQKKQPEGIALLSMYNDDEDDEEMEDPEEEQQQREEENEEAKNLGEDSRINGGDYAVAGERTSTPQQPSGSFVSARQHAASSDSGRTGGGRFTIVDYGHDEVAMSPEPEKGEIHLQNSDDGVPESMPMGSVQVLTPNAQRTPQGTEHLEQLEPDTTGYAVMELEITVAQESVEVTKQEVDPLDKFLPPPPKAKCSEALQMKIDKFISLKRNGKSFNADLRNRMDYRNPDFLLHAVSYQKIDQIGSCFSKDVFDPHGYDQSDYYDEIEADMRRDRERKDLENKKNQKIEFVAGVQSGVMAAAQKPNIPIPGISAAMAGGLQPVPTVTDAVARDGRQNKKSKWDKVDVDRRNPLTSVGQDSLPAVGAHAAILSAANAGAGYTAFAQQRRREAEERRSSERKLERRS